VEKSTGRLFFLYSKMLQYSRWSNSMKTYLTALDDGSFMMVQYGSKIIGKELPVFGGFYATKDNYYVVTGENNTDEDNTKEVYRITKYDKHWNKITSTGLTNCNTTKPFNAGSCRIDVSGNYMIIHTCHEMYKSDDGYNHQANVTIQVDIDKMKITDSYTGVMDQRGSSILHNG
jgi:hypothetical protein